MVEGPNLRSETTLAKHVDDDVASIIVRRCTRYKFDIRKEALCIPLMICGDDIVYVRAPDQIRYQRHGNSPRGHPTARIPGLGRVTKLFFVGIKEIGDRIALAAAVSCAAMNGIPHCVI